MGRKNLPLPYILALVVVLVLIFVFFGYNSGDKGLASLFDNQEINNPVSEPAEFGQDNFTSSSGGFSGGSNQETDFSQPDLPSQLPDSQNSEDQIVVKSGSDRHPDIVQARCGDVFEEGESCDDGNLVDGDGCSASCSIEENYICDSSLGQASECISGDGGVEGGESSCGNGLLNEGESCDDGNGVSRDGCSSNCAAEDGFECYGEPSVCNPYCGDGIVLIKYEQCDDGNIVRNDGCSGCGIQEGFECSGVPSTCTTTCGDGIAVGTETCDDGNLVDGDGCSSTCNLEAPCEEDSGTTGAFLSDPCHFHEEMPIVAAILLVIMVFVFALLKTKGRFKSKLKHLFI